MRRTPHPSHHWQDSYCTGCGTLDVALDGSVEAPCGKPQEEMAKLDRFVTDWLAINRNFAA